jgi:hypothetical protein
MLRVSGLWPAASFAARSAASLPGTPTCAGIHRNWISHPRFRSSSSDRIASTRIYCPDGHLGFRMAWMAACLSVKMVHLPGVMTVVCMSSTICSANASPFSSAAYTVEVVAVPIYSIRLVRMPLSWNAGASAAAPTWPLIPLPSVYIHIVPGSVASCCLIASSADSSIQTNGGIHHAGTTCCWRFRIG